jgi:phosphate starvation-inducible PhoH-like protein
MSEASLAVVDAKSLLSLFGPKDQYLRLIRGKLGVRVSTRDNQIHIEGDDAQVALATDVFEQMQLLVSRSGELEADDVARILAVATGAAEAPPGAEAFELSLAGRRIQPRTAGQARYVQAIRDHDMVFCVGPAGTGKTYLAVAMAVWALKQERSRKIVLVRPAVEAGESLGYLPGDLQAKINPYLRPLLDALRDMLDYDQIKRFTEQDVIEVIPLAYMRGRTLNEAFVILDEAQNTTVSQMKMFLTRMGRGTKVVVSGDTTQIDLPTHATSGLIDATRRLRGIEGLAHVRLHNADIVRHRLVQEIVRAYEESHPARHRPS